MPLGAESPEEEAQLGQPGGDPSTAMSASPPPGCAACCYFKSCLEVASPQTKPLLHHLPVPGWAVFSCRLTAAAVILLATQYIEMLIGCLKRLSSCEQHVVFPS